jgi:hypothetical protein
MMRLYLLASKISRRMAQPAKFRRQVRFEPLQSKG